MPGTEARDQDQASEPRRIIMNRLNKLRVFSGRANLPLAEKIVHCLGDTLGRMTLTDLPDGETSVRTEDDVRRADIFYVQPTCTQIIHHLTKILVMLDCFKLTGADRITVLLP